MKSLYVLCFLVVSACSETFNEEPIPNLTDFHLLIDDTRAKFNQHAVTEPWPAFQTAQASLIKAIDMAEELIEAGDLTTQEAADMVIYEIRHLILNIPPTLPELIAWTRNICMKEELPFPFQSKHGYSKVVERMNGYVGHFCEAMMRGGEMY